MLLGRAPLKQFSLREKKIASNGVPTQSGNFSLNGLSRDTPLGINL